MSLDRKFIAAMLAAGALLAPTAAYAAVDTSLVFEGPSGGAIEADQLSFKTDSGQSVPVEKDKKTGGYVIRFWGDQAEAGTLTYTPAEGPPRSMAVDATPAGREIVVDTATWTVTTRTPPSSGLPSSSTGQPRYSFRPTIYGRIELLTTGIPQSYWGVGDIGGDEHPLVASQDRFSDKAYGGQVLVPIGNFLVGGGYMEGYGCGDSYGGLAPDGQTGGFAFIRESSELGTGVNVGTLGIDIKTRTDFSWRAGNVKLGLPMPLESGADRIVPYVRVTYTEFDMKQTARFSTPAYPDDVKSKVKEKLDLTRWGVGLGAHYTHPLSSKFYLGLDGEATLNFNSWKFDATQYIKVFDSSDSLSVQEDKNGVSVGLAGKLSLTYMLTGRLGINAYGRFSYDENLGRAVNPVSGSEVENGATAGIGSGGSLSTAFGGGLKYSF
jgi:hypothetical protein